jgi:Zn-dependent protease
MSLAGVTANGIFAIFLSILLRVLPASTSSIWPGVSFLVVLQIWAILFNLIPLPPLDGGHFLPYIFPRASWTLVHQLEQYGPFILILLVMTGATRYIVDLRGATRGDLDDGLAAARLFVKTGTLAIRETKAGKETVAAQEEILRRGCLKMKSKKVITIALNLTCSPTEWVGS